MTVEVQQFVFALLILTIRRITHLFIEVTPFKLQQNWLQMKLKEFALFFVLFLGIVSTCYGTSMDSIANITKQNNVSDLPWQLWGYTPHGWRSNFDFEKVNGTHAEVRGIPVKVPGSVQKALLNKGLIKDWNVGMNSLSDEWVTNRNWIFTTTLPAEWNKPGRKKQLKFKGLDGNGFIYLNGKQIGTFDNAFISYTFDITGLMKEGANKLALVFTMPPPYLGQIGWTSKITDWKPRFNYGWDWIPRIVEIGIWDNIYFITSKEDKEEVSHLKVWTNAQKSKDRGSLKIGVEASREARRGGMMQVILKSPEGNTILNERVSLETLKNNKEWENLKVQRWWPNGAGEQPLYNLQCVWYDEKGEERQTFKRKVGFKHVEWLANQDALQGADHWLCAVNGKPLFLQGINWTPIRPNFADLSHSDYERLIKTYHNLGINIIRIWGGGFAEKDWLYNLCDKYGLMIWQEFPLSSSGLDNYPPTDGNAIKQMAKIARHYVSRLRHHVSILLWCGGNELFTMGDTHPITLQHPMIRQLYEVVKSEDPQRRFIPGSPSGPNISTTVQNAGSGDNWETHGPWGLPEGSLAGARKYWAKADALMFTEIGVPGAMAADMIRKYSGRLDVFPANYNTRLWSRFNWWIEWDDYLKETRMTNKEAIVKGLDAYVNWSQERQAAGYVIAVKAAKSRFPKTGGIILWMGHDSYPCPTNNSIIDFEGNLKPAAKELTKIWKTKPEDIK